MRTVLAVLIVLFYFSCGKPSAVSKKLSGSDSLVITFNMPNSDSVRGMVNTTGKNAIRKLTHFLEGKNTMEYKCGYNGSMIFFRKREQVMAIVFNYGEDSCRHFLYDIDNVLVSTRMGKEASDFLQSLGEGRGWY